MGAARRGDRARAAAGARGRTPRPRADASAARRRRGGRVSARRPARRAGRGGSAVARGARAGGGRCLGARADLSQLRRLLPPRLGPRAARRARRRASRPTRRRPSIRSTSRSRALLGAARARTPTARSCSSAVLSLVALVWAALPRSGARVFGRWPGVLAARVRRARASRCCSTRRARYVDVPFLALVVWAAALEAERPQRAARADGCCSRSPALLRPEAWVLAGALLAVVLPRRATGARARGCSRSSLAAPLLWALVDLSVTGDPLHSLHATQRPRRRARPRARPGRRARARSCASWPTRCARPSLLAGARRRRARLCAAAAGARCTCRSRCSPPGVVDLRRRPASPGSRSCRAT